MWTAFCEMKDRKNQDSPRRKLAKKKPRPKSGLEKALYTYTLCVLRHKKEKACQAAAHLQDIRLGQSAKDPDNGG